MSGFKDHGLHQTLTTISTVRIDFDTETEGFLRIFLTDASKDQLDAISYEKQENLD